MPELSLDISYTEAQYEVFFESHAKYTVVKKGRRLGITRGAAHAFIEYMIDGISPLLWVDTINGNIDRYFDRYFLPILQQLPASNWSFNRQKRELRILNSICDFRSADTPESIEGFGYKKIFLNEAGIILKDDYLYSNSILPMLLDYSDSQLIAAGVPKGKHKKNGQKHKFFELYENCLAGLPEYQLRSYTTYDNPFLTKEDIDNLISHLSESEYQQEILGEFIEQLGSNPFAHQYNPAKHESSAPQYDPRKQLLIGMDFNLNPFAVVFAHYWMDNNGEHFHIFDEFEVAHGSIPEMADRIRAKYLNSLPNCRITGDSMGKRGSIEQRDNASLYTQLVRLLPGVRANQLILPNNPTHENSRADVNYILANFPDFKINKETCPILCREMKNTQCDAFGGIIKRNRNDLAQKGDFFDGTRYLCGTFLYKWIQGHSKGLHRNK